MEKNSNQVVCITKKRENKSEECSGMPAYFNIVPLGKYACLIHACSVVLNHNSYTIWLAMKLNCFSLLPSTIPSIHHSLLLFSCFTFSLSLRLVCCILYYLCYHPNPSLILLLVAFVFVFYRSCTTALYLYRSHVALNVCDAIDLIGHFAEPNWLTNNTN